LGARRIRRYSYLYRQSSSCGIPLPAIAMSGGNTAFKNTSGFAKAEVFNAIAANGPDPSVLVEAKGTGAVNVQGQTVQAQVQASAGLSYQIWVKGPTGGTFVLLVGNIIVPGSVVGTSTGTSSATVTVTAPDGTVVYQNGADGIFTTDLFLKGSEVFSPNNVYTINLQATAMVDAVGSDKVDMIAEVDPTFTPEDPSYIIAYSPNLIPTSDTPLPGALPLFATGLGALGLLGWRRKKKAVALGA